MLKTKTIGISPTSPWIFPILFGLLLMQIFIFRASTAMFINSSKILENRDGNIPSSQIGVEQEQLALQIAKAHEVLRVSLRDYLEDVNDANLTFYLEQMRAQKEPYRDEFNQILTSYTKVFFFISQAVDELMKNNYAIGHFEKDQQDVCNVARYLSNQYNFKDRKSVLKKMGDALGKDCDPCTPYKRKQYDKRDVSTRLVADPSIILTDENALCANVTIFTSTTERIAASSTTGNVLSSQEETKTGNRDEVIIDLPAEEKTLKTNQISKAHEVLRVALKDYLELVDANTTFYLEEMRSQSEPFRDEYGQVIPFYKKVLKFITEQVNEMVIGNYAVGQFAKDRHDLCSIARYLSHQTRYSERQTIIQRMSEALGSECDPCIPYRRKQYSKRDTADTNRLCPNVTSASEVDSSNRPFSLIVYKQDDFAPCEYYPETNSVDCNRFIRIEKISNAFKRLSASVPIVQLESFVINTRNQEEIPENLIGNSKIARIAIYCSARDLRVNRNAFKSTEKYTKEILIQSCNLGKVNFTFLNDFDNLVELAIFGGNHLEEKMSSLPILNSLKTLSITYLTKFEKTSFLERLQRMNKSNGTINLRGNRFECNTSICDHAWIIRDHRELLKNIVGATCDNDTPFEKLDPMSHFEECFPDNESSSKDEENRDGYKPTFPLKKDNRLKTSFIIKAHKVLQDALHNYLDVPESNLTVYLNAMRSMIEPFRDEFGQIIPAYRRVFAFILEQVDEVVVENYAIDQFDKDRYDLCSVARYLSHQTRYSGRQTIIQRMGQALNQTTCPPCIPYRRIPYIEDVVQLSLENFSIITSSGANKENIACPLENQSLNTTSSNDNGTVIIPNNLPSETNFLPCLYYDSLVICDELSMAEVHEAFNPNISNDTEELEIETLRIIFKAETTPRELEEIPKDTIGKHRFRHIYLRCMPEKDHSPSIAQLKVNAEAFRSSRKFTTSLRIARCDFRQTDYSFLASFVRLKEIEIDSSVNVKINLASLPPLPSLVHLQIHGRLDGYSEYYISDDIDPSVSSSWVEIPSKMARGLTELSLKGLFDLDEISLDLILDWVLQSSENTLEELHIVSIKFLSKIPRQVAFFNRLKVLKVISDQLMSLPAGSLRFSSPIKQISLFQSKIDLIEPAAFQGDFTEASVVSLTGNQITRFESSVFFSLLQQLKRSNGILHILRNPIDCMEDICHLAWIIRDHRHLLKQISKNTFCENGTLFQDLDEINGFNHCVISL